MKKLRSFFPSLVVFCASLLLSGKKILTKEEDGRMKKIIWPLAGLIVLPICLMLDGSAYAQNALVCEVTYTPDPSFVFLADRTYDPSESAACSPTGDSMKRHYQVEIDPMNVFSIILSTRTGGCTGPITPLYRIWFLNPNLFVGVGPVVVDSDFTVRFWVKTERSCQEGSTWARLP